MNFKGGKKEIQCIECKNSFLVYPGNDTQKYCSKKCSYSNKERNKQIVKTRRSNGGYVVSDETKNKMSISRTGRKLSLTTKLKLREAMKSRCVEGNRVNQFGEYKGGYVNKLRLNLKRILDKKEVGGSHTTIEWINLKEKYQNSCLSCLKQEPEIVLTEDHIIPISKGGKDFINNIQPLCRGCNSKKHTKIIDFRTD